MKGGLGVTHPLEGSDLLRKFEKALRNTNVREGTVKARIADIRRLQRSVPDLRNASTEELLAHLNPQWSVEYRKRTTASIRAFYRWAHAEELIETDPAKVLPSVRVPTRPPLPPAPRQTVLRAFEEGTLHERAIIALAATEALRRTEIATLHPQDRHDMTLHVTGKGGKTREVPLDDITHRILLNLEEEQGRDAYYFPGRFGGHAHPCTIYKWAKRLLGDWSLHSCRRRGATDAFDANPNLMALRDFLGHSSVETSRYYVTVHKKEIEQMVRATSLGYSKNARYIAGLPREDRTHIDEKSQFLEDLKSVTKRAHDLGLDLVLR